MLTHRCECENTLDKWKLWQVLAGSGEWNFTFRKIKLQLIVFDKIVKHTSSCTHFKAFKNLASNYSNVHEVPSYGYDTAGLKKNCTDDVDCVFLLTWFQFENLLIFFMYFQKALETRKVANYIKRALKDAAEFNAQLAQQRREERCSYFDMQTQVRISR